MGNQHDWLPFNLDAIPECSGIYGIYLPEPRAWFYVGKAQNIAVRLRNRYHPVHIAASLSMEKSYCYIPAKSGLGRLEKQIIGELSPWGNGGTSWGIAQRFQCDLPLTTLYLGLTDQELRAAVEV